MSGLNNIIKEIQASAKEEADAILKEADDFCNAQMEEAKIEIEKEIKGFEKKSLASTKKKQNLLPVLEKEMQF